MESEYRDINKALIERCRKGDRKAQFELYERYSRSMYNVSLRILGNSADAEDAMQEAFLNAFRKLDTYSGNVSFGAWLRRIVINRSLDDLKKRKVKFEEISEKSMGIGDDGPEPVAVNMADIHKAIQELPDGYRVVLSLHLIEGYEHEEIGRILQISGSASRTQYLRAKNKLKELLKNRELYIYN